MKIADAIFVGLDTETTGIDPQKDQLVEIAARSICFDAPLLSTFSTLVRPTMPIPPEASGVHHLTDEDVQDAPDRQSAIVALQHSMDNSVDDTVIFAHNAAFDRQFLPELEGFRWLCTMRLAMHVWPDAPNFKNQTLRYWRGHAKLDLEGLAPHRAAADLIVTEAILRDAVAAYLGQGGFDDIDALIAYAESPIRIARWPLGKFRMQPIEAADTGYIEWALGPRGMVDMSRDLRFTLEQTLRERTNAA